MVSHRDFQRKPHLQGWEARFLFQASLMLASCSPPALFFGSPDRCLLAALFHLLPSNSPSYPNVLFTCSHLGNQGRALYGAGVRATSLIAAIAAVANAIAHSGAVHPPGHRAQILAEEHGTRHAGTGPGARLIGSVRAVTEVIVQDAGSQRFRAVPTLKEPMLQCLGVTFDLFRMSAMWHMSACSNMKNAQQPQRY